MTLTSDSKFGEKLTLGSKNDVRNLVSFNASSGKSENLLFDVLLLSKLYYVWAKEKFRSVIYHNIEERYKIGVGTNLCFEKWHEEFGRFFLNCQNSQNLDSNGLLLSKV